MHVADADRFTRVVVGNEAIVGELMLAVEDAGQGSCSSGCGRVCRHIVDQPPIDRDPTATIAQPAQKSFPGTCSHLFPTIHAPPDNRNHPTRALTRRLQLHPWTENYWPLALYPGPRVAITDGVVKCLRRVRDGPVRCISSGRIGFP